RLVVEHLPRVSRIEGRLARTAGAAHQLEDVDLASRLGHEPCEVLQSQAVLQAERLGTRAGDRPELPLQRQAQRRAKLDGRGSGRLSPGRAARVDEAKETRHAELGPEGVR